MARHSAKAVCFDDYRKPPEERKILLILEGAPRSAPSESRNEDTLKWKLPGGKCCSLFEECNCQEHPNLTIVREYAEETGLLVDVIRVLSTYQATRGERTFRRYFYLVRMVDGSLKTQIVNGETSPSWFSVTSLPENIPYMHRAIILFALTREKKFWAHLAKTRR